MKLLKRGGIGLVFLFCLLAWIDPSLAEDMTASIQTARMTVMEVKRDARQLVYVNSQGRVHVHKVTDNTAVVRDDETTTDPGLLASGDVVKAELRCGQIQKIVVLRHAWHEAAGHEQ